MGMAQMGFKSPPKPLSRRPPLTARPISPEQKRERDRQTLQKRTLRALEKARQQAAEQGIDLSDWENEFLNSVSERVKTYGRAFADPDKGAAGGTLSLLQGVKLREIRRKTKRNTDED